MLMYAQKHAIKANSTEISTHTHACMHAFMCVNVPKSVQNSFTHTRGFTIV